MEDMPIGGLENIVRELEVDPYALAKHFGLFKCDQCGASVAYIEPDDSWSCQECHKLRADR